MVDLDPCLDLLTSWIRSSCETFSAILNLDCMPGQSSLRRVAESELAGLSPEEGYCWPMVLMGGLEGELTLFLPAYEAARLVDLMVGGEGNPSHDEFNDMQRDLLSESLRQVTSALGPVLYSVAGRDVKVNLGEPRQGTVQSIGASEYCWCQFPLEVGEGIDVTLSLLTLAGWMESLAERMAPSQSPSPAQAPSAPRAQEAQFAPLSPAAPAQSQPQLDLILDVPLQVQVVLGRTSVLVQDLIHMGEGTVLELDRMAGEPVELYVHDRLVAYGEVIVIDERFGVKVLELAREQRSRNRMAMVG